MTLSARESLILSLLIKGDERYGLQLVAESRGRLKRGTVYVTLGRMEDKGYIVCRAPKRRRPIRAALPRRLYRPTALGRRVLRAVAARRPSSDAGVRLESRPRQHHPSARQPVLRLGDDDSRSLSGASGYANGACGSSAAGNATRARWIRVAGFASLAKALVAYEFVQSAAAERGATARRWLDLMTALGSMALATIAIATARRCAACDQHLGG